ncbi:MAG: hypothetical protein GYA24_00420 [Candidatus Lokiarchaeota archaeon]|nr:hypothetical protein [Candidatus Lokiarchaeota archaeon]
MNWKTGETWIYHVPASGSPTLLVSGIGLSPDPTTHATRARNTIISNTNEHVSDSGAEFKVVNMPSGSDQLWDPVTGQTRFRVAMFAGGIAVPGMTYEIMVPATPSSTNSIQVFSVDESSGQAATVPLISKLTGDWIASAISAHTEVYAAFLAEGYQVEEVLSPGYEVGSWTNLVIKERGKPDVIASVERQMAADGSLGAWLIKTVKVAENVLASGSTVDMSGISLTRSYDDVIAAIRQTRAFFDELKAAGRKVMGGSVKIWKDTRSHILVEGVLDPSTHPDVLRSTNPQHPSVSHVEVQFDARTSETRLKPEGFEKFSQALPYGIGGFDNIIAAFSNRFPSMTEISLIIINKDSLLCLQGTKSNPTLGGYIFEGRAVLTLDLTSAQNTQSEINRPQGKIDMDVAFTHVDSATSQTFTVAKVNTRNLTPATLALAARFVSTIARSQLPATSSGGMNLEVESFTWSQFSTWGSREHLMAIIRFSNGRNIRFQISSSGITWTDVLIRSSPYFWILPSVEEYQGLPVGDVPAAMIRRSRAFQSCTGISWQIDEQGRVSNSIDVRYDQWLVQNFKSGVIPEGPTMAVDSVGLTDVIALLGLTGSLETQLMWFLVYAANGANREFDTSGTPISFASWCEDNHGYSPGTETFLTFLQGKDKDGVRQQFSAYAFDVNAGYIKLPNEP